MNEGSKRHDLGRLLRALEHIVLPPFFAFPDQKHSQQADNNQQTRPHGVEATVTNRVLERNRKFCSNERGRATETAIACDGCR